MDQSTTSLELVKMKTFVINDTSWLYNETDLEGKDGECDPSAISGTLNIDSKQVGKDLLDTITHEWLHALLPMAKEEWVAQEATNFVNLITDKHILTKIGLFNQVRVTDA